MSPSFRSWLRHIRGEATPAPRTRPRPSFRPSLEGLEDRTTPSLIATQVLPLIGSGRVAAISAVRAPTSTTVSVIAPALTASALSGQTITLRANVGSGGAGTPNGGTVNFNLGIFGTVNNVSVVNGVAQTPFTIRAGTATPNTFTVSASYSGNGGFTGSTSSGAGNGTLYFCQDGASTLLSPTLQSFAVLAGSTVTNTGTTNIFGNVGVTPGTAITGFPPGIVNGTLHSGPLDAVAGLAQIDLVTAFTTIQTEIGGFINLTGRDLGGLTLTPGRYHFDNSAQLTGTLTLNDLGNPAARFDFQIGSTLTTASSSRILFINGGADNVYWEVGSSATIGTSSVFAGNILALTDITLNTTASIACGRALARNGAVTMDTNFIDPPPSTPSARPALANTTVAAPAVQATLAQAPTTSPARTIIAVVAPTVSATPTPAPTTTPARPTAVVAPPATPTIPVPVASIIPARATAISTPPAIPASSISPLRATTAVATPAVPPAPAVALSTSPAQGVTVAANLQALSFWQAVTAFQKRLLTWRP